MAYESHLCTCPRDGKNRTLTLLDHLEGCPDYISPEELERELEEFRRDAALLRALAPEPPRELTVHICMRCGKPFFSLVQLRRCHFSGTWVLQGRHYVTYRYSLMLDEIMSDELVPD